MDDIGHAMADEAIETLSARLTWLYKGAHDEMRDRVEKYFLSFEKLDGEMREKLKDGKITKDYYTQWRLARIGRGERLEALRDQYAAAMTAANETAAAWINEETPRIFVLNENYTMYTIEKVAGNVGFDLVDENTVKRLIKEEPDLLPARRVNAPEDTKWNREMFVKNVTSGILQGDSVKHLADRIEDLSDTNRAGAVRNARTAVNSAENAGRQQAYTAAAALGINVKKRWIATKDTRTRDAHAMADGQTVKYDKPFRVDGYKMMHPGDTSAPGRLVWNCRCTTRTVDPQGLKGSERKMRVRDPETGRNVLVSEMTYKQWAKWKEGEAKRQEKSKSKTTPNKSSPS